MKKQTAVTQLIEQLTAVGALEIPEGTNAITMIIADAREMEREQIEEAFNESRLTHPMIGFKHETFKQYYTKTFNP
jgi:hypothetical protein